MLIKDILELSKTKKIAEIAKDQLSIGEKPARKALTEAGCYSIVGQPGWFLEESEDAEVLGKSIYDFHHETLNINTRKRCSFDLDIRIIRRLKVHCAKNDKNLYEVVEKAIDEHLKSIEVQK